MKKPLMLLFALAAFAACNDDDGAPKIRYASSNEAIEDGHLTGRNMFFYGRSAVTDDKGTEYVDEEACFEFAGGFSGDSELLSIYMHRTRFAAEMPPVEMKIPTLLYTGKGNSVSFSADRVVPQANIAGTGYKPFERYVITGLTGSIDGVDCRVAFTCAGKYEVTFTGKLIIKE